MAKGEIGLGILAFVVEGSDPAGVLSFPRLSSLLTWWVASDIFGYGELSARFDSGIIRTCCA